VHNSDATRLQNILSSFDCVQRVNRPTHRDGHILDLLITATDTVVSGLTVGDRVSDHCLITFTVRTQCGCSVQSHNSQPLEADG